jgi:hypothetical protein
MYRFNTTIQYGIGVENLSWSGLIAGETSAAYDDVFTLTYITGRTVGEYVYACVCVVVMCDVCKCVFKSCLHSPTSPAAPSVSMRVFLSAVDCLRVALSVNRVSLLTSSSTYHSYRY